MPPRNTPRSARKMRASADAAIASRCDAYNVFMERLAARAAAECAKLRADLEFSRARGRSQRSSTSHSVRCWGKARPRACCEWRTRRAPSWRPSSRIRWRVKRQASSSCGIYATLSSSRPCPAPRGPRHRRVGRLVAGSDSLHIATCVTTVTAPLTADLIARIVMEHSLCVDDPGAAARQGARAPPRAVGRPPGCETRQCAAAAWAVEQQPAARAQRVPPGAATMTRCACWVTLVHA